jgi:hypothetical protein
MAGWTAAAIGGSAVLGAYASSKAADTQAEAADRATAEQRRQFNKQVALQQPLIDARNNALPDLIAASYYSPFDYNAYQNDPGVGFRLREGLKTLDRSAAARGALLGGNQLRGITQFGQDLASQEYTNAFNRYQAERQAKLGPLQSLVGLGQTSANTVGNAAAQYGNAMAENQIARGNMRASSYMGAANALTGGIGQYLNYQQNKDMMKMYGPRQYGEPTFEQATLDDFSQQQYPGQRNP